MFGDNEPDRLVCWTAVCAAQPATQKPLDFAALHAERQKAEEEEEVPENPDLKIWRINDLNMVRHFDNMVSLERNHRHALKCQVVSYRSVYVYASHNQPRRSFRSLSMVSSWPAIATSCSTSTARRTTHSIPCTSGKAVTHPPWKKDSRQREPSSWPTSWATESANVVWCRARSRRISQLCSRCVAPTGWVAVGVYI